MASENLGQMEKARMAVRLQPGLPGCGGDGVRSGKWRGRAEKSVLRLETEGWSS